MSKDHRRETWLDPASGFVVGAFALDDHEGQADFDFTYWQEHVDAEGRFEAAWWLARAGPGGESRLDRTAVRAERE